MPTGGQRTQPPSEVRCGIEVEVPDAIGTTTTGAESRPALRRRGGDTPKVSAPQPKSATAGSQQRQRRIVVGLGCLFAARG
jgi:hypothetical protein